MAATVAVVVVALIVIVTVPALALFPQPAHRDALTARRCKDADDLVVPAPRPDDAVGTGALHAVHRPAARHEHVARHDHDAIYRYDVLVLHRLLINELGTRVSGCAARETQGRDNEQ